MFTRDPHSSPPQRSPTRSPPRSPPPASPAKEIRVTLRIMVDSVPAEEDGEQVLVDNSKFGEAAQSSDDVKVAETGGESASCLSFKSIQSGGEPWRCSLRES